MDSSTESGCSSMSLEENILSAEELLRYRKSSDRTLPNAGGQKIYGAGGSWLEEKQVDCLLRDKLDLLSEPRQAKLSDLVQGEWDPHICKVKITKTKSKLFQHMGIRVRNAIHLYPEEALFAMEMCALEVLYNKVPLSLQEAYAVLLPEPPKLRRYQVYSHLSRLGYTVVMHQGRLNDGETEVQMPTADTDLRTALDGRSKADPIILSDEDSVEILDASAGEKNTAEFSPWQHSRTSYCSEHSMSVDTDNTNSESETEMAEARNLPSDEAFKLVNAVEKDTRQVKREDKQGEVGIKVEDDDLDDDVEGEDDDDSNIGDVDEDDVVVSSEMTPGLPVTIRSTSFLTAFLPSKYSHFTPGLNLYKRYSEGASKAEIPLITIEDPDAKPTIGRDLECTRDSESDTDEVQIVSEEQIDNEEQTESSETDTETNEQHAGTESWVLKAEFPAHHSEDSRAVTPIEPLCSTDSSREDEDDGIVFPNMAGKEFVLLTAVPENLLPANLKLYREIYKIKRDAFTKPENTRPTLIGSGNRNYRGRWSGNSNRRNFNPRWSKQNDFAPRHQQFSTSHTQDSFRNTDLVQRQNQDSFRGRDLVQRQNQESFRGRGSVQRKSRWDVPNTSNESSSSVQETQHSTPRTYYPNKNNNNTLRYRTLQPRGNMYSAPTDNVQNENDNLPVPHSAHNPVRHFLPPHHSHQASDHHSSDTQKINLSNKQISANQKSSSHLHNNPSILCPSIPSDTQTKNLSNRQRNANQKSSSLSHNNPSIPHESPCNPSDTDMRNENKIMAVSNLDSTSQLHSNPTITRGPSNSESSDTDMRDVNQILAVSNLDSSSHGSNIKSTDTDMRDVNKLIAASNLDSPNNNPTITHGSSNSQSFDTDMRSVNINHLTAVSNSQLHDNTAIMQGSSTSQPSDTDMRNVNKIISVSSLDSVKQESPSNTPSDTDMRNLSAVSNSNNPTIKHENPNTQSDTDMRNVNCDLTAVSNLDSSSQIQNKPATTHESPKDAVAEFLQSIRNSHALQHPQELNLVLDYAGNHPGSENHYLDRHGDIPLSPSMSHRTSYYSTIPTYYTNQHDAKELSPKQLECLENEVKMSELLDYVECSKERDADMDKGNLEDKYSVNVKKDTKKREKDKREGPDIVMLSLPQDALEADKMILPSDCNFVSFDLSDCYQETDYCPDGKTDKRCSHLSESRRSPDTKTESAQTRPTFESSDKIDMCCVKVAKAKQLKPSEVRSNNLMCEVQNSEPRTSPKITPENHTNQNQSSSLWSHNVEQHCSYENRSEELRESNQRPKTFHEPGSWRQHRAFSTAHPRKRPRREEWRDGEEYPTVIVKVGVEFHSWCQYKHIVKSFNKMQGLGMGEEKVLYTGRVFPLIRNDDPAVLDDMMSKLRIIPQVNLTFGDRNSSVDLPSERNELMFDFDVYLPNVNYRLSCRTTPNLRLIVVSADDPVPLLSPLVNLQVPFQDGSPVYFAVVGDDNPVFYGLHDISLPDFTKPQS